MWSDTDKEAAMEMLGSWSHILGIWYSACCTVSARRLKSDNTEVRRRQSRPEAEGISTESGSAGKWPCALAPLSLSVAAHTDYLTSGRRRRRMVFRKDLN